MSCPSCCECERLRAQVYDLQTANSKYVYERQAAHRYGDRRRRQRTLLDWAVRTFGDVARSTHERAMRLVEEALEAAQAAGLSRSIVERLVERVYTRDPGDLRSELGGVAITLAMLAHTIGEPIEELERDEIERVFGIDPNVLRAKHTAKQEAGIAVAWRP